MFLCKISQMLFRANIKNSVLSAIYFLKIHDN